MSADGPGGGSGEFSPLELCEEMLASLGAKALERGVHLQAHWHWPLPSGIQADRTLLSRQLAKLLTQAIESASAGQVLLEVRANREEGLVFAAGAQSIALALPPVVHWMRSQAGAVREPSAELRAEARARLATVRAHFIARLHQDVPALRAELAAGEGIAAAERLHRIRGAGSMFGMQDLCAACAQAEHALRAGSAPDSMDALWEALRVVIGA